MRLLIVEDEPDMLRRLGKIFRAQGYAVDMASDGEEGLYKARETDYDGILLDAMLPVMDGWELMRRLRPEKKTPILMLTARDASDDRVRGLDGGADDYVVKPFDLPELLARVRALLRRGSARGCCRVECGGIVIDTARKNVYRDGISVELKPSEYIVLEYLAMNRGRLVTRTELYEHLFDEREDFLSNLLDVRISNLRKKLGQQFIVTKRGLGYGIEIE